MFDAIFTCYRREKSVQAHFSREIHRQTPGQPGRHLLGQIQIRQMK